jgi:hypothetical protein
LKFKLKYFHEESTFNLIATLWKHNLISFDAAWDLVSEGEDAIDIL